MHVVAASRSRSRALVFKAEPAAGCTHGLPASAARCAMRLPMHAHRTACRMHAREARPMPCHAYIHPHMAAWPHACMCVPAGCPLRTSPSSPLNATSTGEQARAACGSDSAALRPASDAQCTGCSVVRRPCWQHAAASCTSAGALGLCSASCSLCIPRVLLDRPVIVTVEPYDGGSGAPSSGPAGAARLQALTYCSAPGRTIAADLPPPAWCVMQAPLPPPSPARSPPPTPHRMHACLDWSRPCTHDAHLTSCQACMCWRVPLNPPRHRPCPLYLLLRGVG